MPYLIVREVDKQKRILFQTLGEAVTIFARSPPELPQQQLPGGRAAAQRGADGHREVVMPLRPQGREEQVRGGSRFSFWLAMILKAARR